jgi:hypothetical protein
LPGALLVVVSLRIMMRRPPSAAALALGSTAAGLLLWLHVRYITLSLALMLGLLIAVCSRGQGTAAVEPRRRIADRIAGAKRAAASFVAVARASWGTILVALVVPFVIVVGAQELVYKHLYGTFRPGAGYHAYGDPGIGAAGWRFFYDYVLTDLLNPVVGWIPFAPVHWLGLAALGCLIVRFGARAAACVAAAAAYEFVVASAAPSVGWGFPARYPMIIIPLIAVPLAVALEEVRIARFVFVPLLAVSLVLSAAAVENYTALYPATSQPQLFGARSIATAFPTTQRAPLLTSFALAAGQPAPQTGRVEGSAVVARAGRDAPGYVVYGPAETRLSEGVYKASFLLAASASNPRQGVAALDVIESPNGPVLASKLVTAGGVGGRRPSRVVLRFATPGQVKIETRVYYTGAGTLRAEGVRVVPEETVVPLPSTFPDWPLVFLWLAGTALIGWLFVEVRIPPGMRRSLIAD